MPSAHDMVREFRILSELDGTGFPAPRPRALCTDHSLLGVTFLVYDYVPGLAISDEAAAAQLSARQADTVCGELVATLARLHELPPPPAAPGRSASATDYLRRQVTRSGRPVGAHGDQGPARVPPELRLAAGRGQRPPRTTRSPGCTATTGWTT